MNEEKSSNGKNGHQIGMLQQEQQQQRRQWNVFRFTKLFIACRLIESQIKIIPRWGLYIALFVHMSARKVH